MNSNVLISKIEQLQEAIKNQSKISQLDVDLQLDYIRKLYDAYLELKYNFTDIQYQMAEKSDEEDNTAILSDCRTLSLFENGEVKTAEQEDVEVEMEKTISGTSIVEESEEEEEEVVEENEEDDLPIIEMDVKEFSIPDISVEQKMVSEINLDDIEFDDESNDDEDTEIKNDSTSFSATMPHSRYYGDEIEIENPIPVQSTTIGERFKSERPSLNEIVSSYKPDESIGSKLQQGNVSDLMKSMDMNHKFMFVKELFKSNGSVFTEEINKLNAFNKLNEAIPYWESMKAKYKWDSQSEAYTELYRLILRKFAK